MMGQIHLIGDPLPLKVSYYCSNFKYIDVVYIITDIHMSDALFYLARFHFEQSSLHFSPDWGDNSRVAANES